MFDLLRKKFDNQMIGKNETEKKIREDLFGILIEAEVNYSLAEKISYELIENLKTGLEYKQALQKSIKNNINKKTDLLKKGILLFVGFQGHGKTTNSHKLAYHLKQKGFKVGVGSLDNHREGAQIQLEENLKRFKIPFVHISKGESLEEKCAFLKKEESNYDYLIIDTAGINYSVDSPKSEELKLIEKVLKPSEIIIIVNTLLGHSLFKILEEFKENLSITGAIMTNVDGDKKGGGFLSFYYMLKVPIFYLSNGEQVQNFEIFDPSSISNILIGEMDLEGLHNIIKNNETKSVEEIFMNDIVGKGIFTFEHFLLFTNQTKSIGLGRIALGLGLKDDKFKDSKQNESNIKVINSIIHSMTKKEKKAQVLIDSSRIKRISKGSGRPVEMITQFLNAYENTKKHMLQLSSLLKSGNQDVGQLVGMLKNLIKEK